MREACKGRGGDGRQSVQTTEERRLSPQGQQGRKEGDTKRAAQPLGKCRPTLGSPSSASHQAPGEVGAVGVPCVTSGTGLHPPTCACLLENVCKARSAPAPRLTLGTDQEKALKRVCFSGSQKQGRVVALWQNKDNWYHTITKVATEQR